MDHIQSVVHLGIWVEQHVHVCIGLENKHFTVRAYIAVHAEVFELQPVADFPYRRPELGISSVSIWCMRARDSSQDSRVDMNVRLLP